MSDEHDDPELDVVDVEIPGARFSFPATPRTVVFIVACVCSAIVLCVGLIFVKASADNIETFGGLLRKPEKAEQPSLTIYDGATMGGSEVVGRKLEPP